MYQFEQPEMTGPRRLTATGATPAELLEAALRGVLDAARDGRPRSVPDDVIAVPLRGTGADLGQLFLALTRDLIGQLEEFGPGLDGVRLDGLLRTDTGGYTAWGYLSGPQDVAGQAAIALTVGEPVIAEIAGEWRLACNLHFG